MRVALFGENWVPFVILALAAGFFQGCYHPGNKGYDPEETIEAMPISAKSKKVSKSTVPMVENGEGARWLAKLEGFYAEYEKNGEFDAEAIIDFVESVFPKDEEFVDVPSEMSFGMNDDIIYQQYWRGLRRFSRIRYELPERFSDKDLNHPTEAWKHREDLETMGVGYDRELERSLRGLIKYQKQGLKNGPETATRIYRR